jgi:sugar O-acyltransferase (sialic acid O-acetyltransferase NeuD family)
MKKINVVIFGTGKISEIAHYYIKKNLIYNILGFSLQKKYIKKDKFIDLPIFEFENIVNTCPPIYTKLFAPCPASKINKFREDIYMAGKKKGYNFISYVSPDAIVNTDKIGENNLILELNNIQPYVEIGNNCILWSGNHIGHHSKIKDNVFIASHAVISGNCVVENNAYIGVNSTIKDGVTIKNHSIIGMGSVVTKNTEEFGIYVGNPAKLLKKADENTNL